MNMQQPDFPEATVVETLQRLEEAAARIFGALRDNAREHEVQQAGALEYDSWSAAIEYDSWFTGRR